MLDLLFARQILLKAIDYDEVDTMARHALTVVESRARSLGATL